MTVATQTETRTPARARPAKRRGMIVVWQHRALRAEWAKFSPQLEWECTEREARLRFTNEVLRQSAIGNSALAERGRESSILSWAALTYGEANRLLRVLKETSGSNAAWRAMKLAQIAAELFGGDWDSVLRERLMQRFRVASPESLAPNEAHAEIEELLSRIARRDGAEIETVRQRFFGKKVR